MKRIIIILLIVGLILLNGCAELETKTQNKLPEYQKDELISKCEEDFNYYKSISEKKYSISIDLLETKKMDNLEETKEFERLWGTPWDINYDINPNAYEESGIKGYPIVLFALNLKNPQGGAIPFIVVCGNEGKLTERAKTALLGTV